MAAAAKSLHFLPQQDIMAKLAKNPLTMNYYTQRKDLIAAVVEVFADRTKSSSGITMAVTFAVHDINSKRPDPLSQSEIVSIIQDLSLVIRGCVVKK